MESIDDEGGRGNTTVRDWNWWSDFLQREYYAGLSEQRGWDAAALSVATAVALKPGMSVLDLGSGSGEMLYRLALRGADVVGVEQSSALVAHCRRNAAKLGVRATFIDANMFEFDPERQFDVVLSLNTSFGYGTDEQNRRLIARIGDWLLPGGAFYFDVATADHADSFGRWSDHLAGGRLIVESRYDREQRTMVNDPSWVTPDASQVYTATAPEMVRLYERSDLEEMMRAAGMVPERQKRAMGRGYRQSDEDLMTTWVARKGT